VIVKLVVIIWKARASSPDRLVRLILLIALAMTAAWLQGQRTQLQRQQSYVCRSQEKGRTRKRHSNFWIGLYGQNWSAAFHGCQIWANGTHEFHSQ
jgi:hypothetical protein